MTRAAEALTAADAAWLHAEAPTNHFVVTSLALLDRPVDPRRVLEMLERRLELHPRLRQVVQEPPLPGRMPQWVPAPDFDLRAHVHTAALPAPHGKRELETLVSDLIGQPLDFGRPLWELYLVEGPGAGGALISRFHHALGDGQAMVKMLLTLTDRTPSGWRSAPVETRRRRRPAPGALERLGDLVEWLPHAPESARRLVSAGGTVASLTLMDPDPPTPLRGPLSLLKRAAWSRPLPLTRVKRVAAATGATLNDVIVSCIAGALGGYLRDQGLETAGLRIRAMVPVNLRPSDDAGMTENRFSLVYVELPVGVRDARERLLRVRTEMNRIKASDEPQVGWMLLRSLGLVPPRLEQVASRFYADKASLVLTNVIGPREPIYLGGVRIREMTFWEPESGGLGVGVSIFSYAGEVVVGAVSDVRLVAEPARLVAGVEEAFEDLSRHSRRRARPEGAVR